MYKHSFHRRIKRVADFTGDDRFGSGSQQVRAQGFAGFVLSYGSDAADRVFD